MRFLFGNSKTNHLNFSALRFRRKAKKTSPESWWGDENDVRLYLNEFLPKKIHGKILDISCGPGFVLDFHFREKKISSFCCDLDITKLKICRYLFLIRNAFLATATNLPLPDESMDLVLLIHSFPEWDYQITKSPENKLDQRRQVVLEASRVLKKDGIFIASTPNREFPRYRFADKGSYKELTKLFSGSFHSYQCFGWNKFGFTFMQSENKFFAKIINKIADLLLCCFLIIGKNPSSLIEKEKSKIRQCRSIVVIAKK